MESAGFYLATEDSGRTQEQGGEEDWRQLFIYITNRTGWGPREISLLTLDQLFEYLRGWNTKSAKKKGTSPNEVAMFNLAVMQGK